MAFLYREYKYLAVFIVVVALIISIFLQVQTAICFVFGAIFSILAGYLGMNVATKANVRTAEGARHADGYAESPRYGSPKGYSYYDYGWSQC